VKASAQAKEALHILMNHTSDAVLLGIIPILAFYPLSHIEWPE
jgi:hypothetical protein